MAKFLAGCSTNDDTIDGLKSGFDSYSKDRIVVAYQSEQVLPVYRLKYQL